MSKQAVIDTTQARRVPSGPKGYPVVGLIPRLMRDMMGTYREAAELGGIVELDMGLRKGYLVTDPDLLRYILLDNYKNYVKGEQMDVIRPLLGNGLFLSEGDFWFAQRRLMQPAFYRPKLSNLAELMVNATQAVADRWETLPAGEHVNMLYEMRQVTQMVIVEAMFSTSISREETIRAGEALDFALLTLVERSITPLSVPEWLPTAKNRRLQESLATLDEFVYRFINERRELIKQTEDGFDPTGDLLSMLMNVRYEDTGEGMTDEQLRDEVMTMFLAGHETTANTLSWTWYLLAEHPEVEEQIHEELDRVLGGRRPTFEDLDRLDYTRMVIDEVLRVYPPVWMTARQAVEDDVIGGYTIPAGSMLMLGFYFLHHNPRYWDAPEAFRPERFTEEANKARPRWVYLPFGGGPRVCIGQHFALMEAQLALALLAQKFRARVMPGRDVSMQLMGTLQPTGGLWMTLEQR